MVVGDSLTATVVAARVELHDELERREMARLRPQADTGANVAGRLSGGQLGSGKWRSDGLKIRSPLAADRRGSGCRRPGRRLRAQHAGNGIAGAVTNGPGRNGVSTKATPKKGGTLTFGVDAEEQGFDPTQAQFDEVGVMYARTVFDPLTIILTNGHWAPYLAQSVVPSSSYTAWTITLRPNLVFHDGTPCNGAALLTNLQAQSKSLLNGVVINPTLVSITQTGPLAVTITFKSPWVPFPYYLAGGIGGQIAYVVAPSMLRNPNGTAHPVGTGPFVFKEWIPNDHFTATANPHYWRKGMPYLSQITYKPIPDQNGRSEALQSGTIDLMVTDTTQIINQYRGNRNYSYIDDSTHVAGEPDMNCVQLNCLAAPFNNADVRRAAAMAINRRQYAQVIDEGVLPVSTGLFVPGSPYYSTTPYPAYNPSRAAALVKRVEWTGHPISFTLGNTNGPVSVRQQAYLQQAWQSVGFQVKTAIIEQNAFINNALAGEYQALKLAPVRSGRPRPQLHLLEHDHRQFGVICPSTWPAMRTRRSRRRFWRGGPAPSRASAGPPTRRSTSALPSTSPTCGWTVRCGPLSAAPVCRTSTTRPRRWASPRSG